MSYKTQKKNAYKNKSFNKQNKQMKHLPIGQTLETKDCYLPVDKKHSKELKSSRPVIIADKLVNPQGKEEYLIIPTSTKDTRNTHPYNKHGINYIRNNIEIVDNEGKPIMQNEKFRKTNKCSRLPESDTIQIYNNTVNRTRFSSENRKKQENFWNRYKKR